MNGPLCSTCDLEDSKFQEGPFHQKLPPCDVDWALIRFQSWLLRQLSECWASHLSSLSSKNSVDERSVKPTLVHLCQCLELLLF